LRDEKGRRTLLYGGAPSPAAIPRFSSSTVRFKAGRNHPILSLLFGKCQKNDRKPIEKGRNPLRLFRKNACSFQDLTKCKRFSIILLTRGGYNDANMSKGGAEHRDSGN
jgi:hypothetical protein